jgi:hypothetical protein
MVALAAIAMIIVCGAGYARHRRALESAGAFPGIPAQPSACGRAVVGRRRRWGARAGTWRIAVRYLL